MFFTYLRRELRRRMRQAIFISLGLALGIGLVITVTAASAGVKDAQGTVLQNPVNMGYLTVKSMVDHLRGGKVERRIDTGVAIATPENMEQPDIHALLHPEQAK